jgi:PAS domain-containing protein
MHEPEMEDYKQFFEETPVALLRTDLKTGEFLMANQYAVEMFGFGSFDELQASAKITDFYPPQERRKMIQQIRKHGAVKGYELQLALPCNKTIHVSARLRINCGNTCIEGSLIDISEYVVLRERCMTQQAEIGKKLDKKLTALAG